MDLSALEKVEQAVIAGDAPAEDLLKQLCALTRAMETEVKTVRSDASDKAPAPLAELPSRKIEMKARDKAMPQPAAEQPMQDVRPPVPRPVHPIPYERTVTAPPPMSCGPFRFVRHRRDGGTILEPIPE